MRFRDGGLDREDRIGGRDDEEFVFGGRNDEAEGSGGGREEGVETGGEKGSDEADKINKLKPGTGSIGPNGTALLIDYEDLGDEYKVYENGKITAILSRDVEWYGNITYGYGNLFYNTPEDRKRLKDLYGLEFGEKSKVPIELCERMYWDYINKNMEGLHNFTRDNKIRLNQNQMDALVMHRYLTGELRGKTRDLLIEMFKDKDIDDAKLKELYWDRFLDALLGDLKDMNKDDPAYFERYKEGWTNRILDERELFFDGDGKRNH